MRASLANPTPNRLLKKAALQAQLHKQSNLDGADARE